MASRGVETSAAERLPPSAHVLDPLEFRLERRREVALAECCLDEDKRRADGLDVQFRKAFQQNPSGVFNVLGPSGQHLRHDQISRCDDRDDDAAEVDLNGAVAPLLFLSPQECCEATA